jgi:hypothetical protein
MEQEIIVLRAVWDMIQGMVNYEIFLKNHGTVETELRFKTATHQRLFNILLADFLSAPPAGTFDLPEATGSAQSDRSYLFYLRRICDSPTLNGDSSILREPIETFIEWLESECLVENVWFPSVEIETDIRVKRIAFIKITGDIAKHNFARLSRNVDRIGKILADNGAKIPEGQGFLVLPDFFQWFHKDVFSYHASSLAEMLNNIRWGIYGYLKPEFTRSFKRDPEVSYKYEYSYPSACQQPLAKAIYWDLMNQIRTEPFFPPFTVTKMLKLRY